MRVSVDGMMISQLIEGVEEFSVQLGSIELMRLPARVGDGKEGIRKGAQVVRSVFGSTFRCLRLGLELSTRRVLRRQPLNERVIFVSGEERRRRRGNHGENDVQLAGPPERLPICARCRLLEYVRR